MALIPCGECGAQISDRAGACPRCGAPVSGGQAPVAAQPGGGQTAPVMARRPLGKPAATLIAMLVAVGCLVATWAQLRTALGTSEGDFVAQCNAGSCQFRNDGDVSAAVCVNLAWNTASQPPLRSGTVCSPELEPNETATVAAAPPPGLIGHCLAHGPCEVVLEN